VRQIWPSASGDGSVAHVCRWRMRLLSWDDVWRRRNSNQREYEVSEVDPEAFGLHVSTLAEMDIAQAETVRGDLPVGAVDLDRSLWWVVVDGSGHVQGAVSAAELRAADPRTVVGAALPARFGTIIADPECPVVVALGSHAFGLVDSPFVVVLRDEAGVVGVWAGEDLDEVLEFGTARVGVDVGLSHPPRVPYLVRSCAYQDEPSRVRCRASRAFSERPSSAVDCANPSGLPKHEFVW
jgi:hypothetical protein